jgi:hypothetical protein
VFLRILPVVVILGALVYFAGATEIALILVLVGGVAMIALNFLRRNESAPPPELGPDQASALRAERERSGEVAAVRRLRKEHPGVSLLDAVRLVRRL